MAQVEVIARRWGSSLGIVIPKEIVEDEMIKENEKIKIEIKRTIQVRDIWGMAGDLKIDAQKAKDEMRRGWE